MRSNTMKNIIIGKGSVDMEQAKLEKKQFLDDSVKYADKKIDPYATQQKRDAEFYREILLKDANVIPESRDISSKPVDPEKAKLLKVKTSRELFNA